MSILTKTAEAKIDRADGSMTREEHDAQLRAPQLIGKGKFQRDQRTSAISSVRRSWWT
jgi:hypothetical protein